MEKLELMQWRVMPLVNLIPSSVTKSHCPKNFPITESNTKSDICNIRIRPFSRVPSCRARRVRYEVPEDEDGEVWHNEEISMLELYSQSSRKEALIVHAVLDEQEEEVLIFKGFSSSLSFGTSSDPSRSVLPARAEIISIDRVKGPFDPSNIQYLEKGLTWEDFKSRMFSA